MLGTFLPLCWSTGILNVLQLSVWEPSSFRHMQKPLIFSLDVLIQVASPKFPFPGSPSKRRWNHLGQLHCRKWAMSENPGLSISTQQGGEELQGGQSARGRRRREELGELELPAQPEGIWGAKPLCLLCFHLWSLLSAAVQSLTPKIAKITPVILTGVNSLIRWTGGQLHFKSLTLAV